MADLTKVPVHLLSSEHYRQMLVRDGERRFREWHTEFLRYQKQFQADRERRIRELENLRKSSYEERKRRSLESQKEYLGYKKSPLPRCPGIRS